MDRSNINILSIGAAVRVKVLCNASHDFTWDSSSQVGEGKKKCFIINLYLAMFTLFTGLNISQV